MAWLGLSLVLLPACSFFFPSGLRIELNAVERYRLDAPFESVADAATLHFTTEEGAAVADRSPTRIQFAVGESSAGEDSSAQMTMRERDGLLVVRSRTSAEASEQDHGRLGRLRRRVRELPGVGPRVSVDGESLGPQEAPGGEAPPAEATAEDGPAAAQPSPPEESPDPSNPGTEPDPNESP